MLLIAGFLVLATLIPQKPELTKAEYFTLKQKYPLFTKFISFTGLDHIYTSWWFLAVVSVFTLNLVLNLTGRIKITLRHMSSNKSPPSPDDIERSKYRHVLDVTVLDDALKERLTRTVSGLGFNVKQFREGILGTKKMWGLWGIPLFHGSLLLILTGIMISGLTRFSGTFEIAEGQTFSGQAEELIQTHYGLLALKPKPDFQLMLRKFNVEHWAPEHPKLIQSTVDVYEEGNLILSEKVEINKPLKYKGFAFYQSRYFGHAAYMTLLDKVTGQSNSGYVNFPSKKHDTGVFKQSFVLPLLGYRAQIKYDPLYPELMVIKILNGTEVKWEGIVKKGGGVDLGRYYLRFNDIVKWTAFFVSWDKGIPVLYSGFVVLSLSVLGLVFVVPRRLWLLYNKDKILVGVEVLSRSMETFEEEFEKIVKSLKESIK
jgi:cytochrome c biogenesis protein